MSSESPVARLEGQALHDAFPFFLLLDVELRVVGGGRGWAKLGGAPLGPVGGHFELLWPQNEAFSSQDVACYVREGVHIRCRRMPLKLRAQWVPQAHGALLLCSPEIRSLSVLDVLGLSLEDLALHDASAELSALIHTLDVSLQDANELADRLKRRRLRLKKSKEQAEVARVVAERALAARNNFLATMSHELRTPINGIVGMAHLLDEGELGPRQRDQLATLTRASQDLAAMVDNILRFTHMNSGGSELDVEWVDPRSIAGELVWKAADDAEEKGLSLRYSVANDAPRRVEVDKKRVQEILVRLLSNAVKFTEFGEIELLIGYREGQLEVQVCDTGIGISADALPTIFEPFTQADLTHTRRHGGVGLGLSIAQHIAGRLGGSLSVQSELGEGSCFTLAVPALVQTGFATEIRQQGEVGLEANQAPGTPPLRPPTLSSGLRVLIVEDNPVNQRVAEGILRHMGNTVSVVNNGLEGVEHVRRSPVDLVIMDCQMPVMDGFEATEVIRREQGPSLPIVALTAAVLPEDRERAARVGMDAFLAKPLDVPELVKVVNALLERRAREAQGASGAGSVSAEVSSPVGSVSGAEGDASPGSEAASA